MGPYMGDQKCALEPTQSLGIFHLAQQSESAAVDFHYTTDPWNIATCICIYNLRNGDGGCQIPYVICFMHQSLCGHGCTCIHLVHISSMLRDTVDIQGHCPTS